ncbi:hypothetical protein MTO96_029524 [Rhipicephalus appendiculatus]
MSFLKFANWNVRGFRDRDKQRMVLSFAREQKIDLLFVQEANLRSPLDVAKFRRNCQVDAFFSLSNAKSCGVGVIFVPGRFRQRSHCVFGANGRTIMVDIYTDGRKIRFVNVYAPGRSTYHARELVKILRHLRLTDVWVHVHDDAFGPTRVSRTTASRIDRAYVPDFLLSSVVSCEVLAVPNTLAGKTDHAPLVTTKRGTPGPRSGNTGWRMDPAILKDDTSTSKIKNQLEETIRAISGVTPETWDSLKAAWRALLQKEGSERKRRISNQMNELQRRMRIIQGADALTACTRDYLDSLQEQHDRLLQEKTRRPSAARAPSGDASEVDLREVSGNGCIRITEAKRPDGTTTADPAEITAIFRDHFRSAFREPEPGEARPDAGPMKDLCKCLRRLDEAEYVTLCGEALKEELRLERFRCIFSSYAEASGAQLNEGKSKALLFGPFPAEAIGSIERVSTVKVLGIFFTCEGVAPSTWTRVLERARQFTERAKLLNLTLREKALAVKTSICALAFYASRVFVIPVKAANQLNKLIHSFLWDEKPALASDYTGRGLLLYWSGASNAWLEAGRHLGPLAESPSPYYKAASATSRMLGKEAPSCDADTDPPARIVEDLTLNQLSDEDRQRARNAKRTLAQLDRGSPREVHDFLWKMGWKVLPTRQRLNRLGIDPDARCPNCRNIESQNHALLECPAAKPVWRIVARCFGIRPPPAHKRNRGAFARLVMKFTLFIIWQRRSLAEVRSTPVRAAYPAVAKIRRLLWAFLSKELEGSGEEKFLRRWHTRFFYVKDGKLHSGGTEQPRPHYRRSPASGARRPPGEGLVSVHDPFFACLSRPGRQCLLATPPGPGLRDRRRLAPLGPPSALRPGVQRTCCLGPADPGCLATRGGPRPTTWPDRGRPGGRRRHPALPDDGRRLRPRTPRHHRLLDAGARARAPPARAGQRLPALGNRPGHPSSWTACSRSTSRSRRSSPAPQRDCRVTSSWSLRVRYLQRHLVHEHGVSMQRRENVCATCDVLIPARSSGHTCSDGSRSAPGPTSPRFACPHCPREFVLQRYLRKHVRRHEQPGVSTPVPVLERRPPNARDSPRVSPSGAPVPLPVPPASLTLAMEYTSATSLGDTPPASSANSAAPVRAHQPTLARGVLRVYLPLPPDPSLSQAWMQVLLRGRFMDIPRSLSPTTLRAGARPAA